LFINTPSFSAKIRSSKRKERNGISNEKKKKKIKKKKEKKGKNLPFTKGFTGRHYQSFCSIRCI
jgi:hypothetical protein